MTTLSVALGASYSTGNAVTLRELPRNLLERLPIDLGLGELLGRDEARVVVLAKT